MSFGAVKSDSWLEESFAFAFDKSITGLMLEKNDAEWYKMD